MPKGEHGAFHAARIRRGGIGVLAIAAMISVVVGAFLVLSPHGRPFQMTGGSPSSGPTRPRGSTSVDDEVRLWDTATGHTNILVSGPGLGDPELSPNGEEVVYEREDPNGQTQIFRLDADGQEHRLTDFSTGASDPTWSPDGRVAFSATLGEVTGRGTGTDILVMDADGSHVRRLGGTEFDDEKPDWSPDGSRVVFQSRADDEVRLWVASTQTQSLHEIGADESWSATEPAWSPDGRWIAYIRYRNGAPLDEGRYDSESELWRVRSDGTDHRSIASSGGLIRSSPSWSPDGRLIVFEQDDWTEDEGERRVYVSNPRTRVMRSFLKSSSGAWWVAFDPSWGSRGILVIRPSIHPIFGQLPLPATFGSAPAPGGSSVDATVRMTEGSCELEGAHRWIRPGKLKLRLVNASLFEAQFTVVKLREWRLARSSSMEESFLFRRDHQRSLYPWTSEVWSDPLRVGAGHWAIVCQMDREEPAPTEFFVWLVGVAGPLDVGSNHAGEG